MLIYLHVKRFFMKNLIRVLKGASEKEVILGNPLLIFLEKEKILKGFIDF